MKKIGITFAFAIIILSSSIWTLDLVEAELEQPLTGSPDIRIVLDQEKIEVDVEPGNDGLTIFTGTVYCNMPPSTPPGQYCYINLQADAGGWPCSVPASLDFDRNHEEEDFTITVQVPTGTSSCVMGQLSVSGRWSYSPGVSGGTIPASTAIIVVLPFSKPVISADLKNSTISVGEWGEIDIIVTNEGNANDDIQLRIIDIPPGVDAYLEEDTLSVPEKQAKTIILKVKQSNGAPKSHQLVISAKGLNNGTRAQDQQTVTFETETSFRSLITTPYVIIPFIIILMIGGAITYKLVRKKIRKNGD